MQKYFALSAMILWASLIITCVFSLKKGGIKVMYFGNMDKMDFLIVPFALYYFYLLFANAFNLPFIDKKELFRVDAVSWSGVFLCLAGILLLVWSLVSFRKGFRVGIDTDKPDELITRGVFAFSRNPIFISLEIVLLGQFLIFSNWILLVYIAAAVLLIHRQIMREEEFLRAHYGREYMDYCRKVRRYI